jgi:regulator of sigma E protease
MDAILGFFKFLGILLMVVMVFNLLIIVHEWGHFLAARWRGLMVDRFQIWFGKPIWKKKINGVQYGLGSIPAGGFVSLPQMAPMGAIEGRALDEDEEGEKAEDDSDSGDAEDKEIDPRDLPPISALDKIIVAFAGPLFSFLLAVAFAFVVWGVGKPVAQMAQTTTIGHVASSEKEEEKSPGQLGGFKVGDEILSVDGKKIVRFHGMIDSVDWNFITSTETQVPVVVNRPGEGELTLYLKKDIEAANADPDKDKKSWWTRTTSAIFNRSRLPDTGLRGTENPMIAKVSEGHPADKAGIQANDVIMKIDGKDVPSRFFVEEYVENRDQPIELELLRGEETVNVSLTPLAIKNIDEFPESAHEELRKRRILGLRWDDFGMSKIAHPTPVEQVTDGFRVIVSTLKAVGSKGTGVNAGHLSGPVGIMRLYYRLFQHPDGWRMVLWFSVILNINLAILNLLPLPVLDGGHITMALIEGATRKPINFRVLEVVQTACVILLLGFMAFVTLKDAGDLFGGGGGGEIEIELVDPAAPEGDAAPQPQG